MHAGNGSPTRQITCTELLRPAAQACCMKSWQTKALLTPAEHGLQQARKALTAHAIMHLGSLHQLDSTISALPMSAGQRQPEQSAACCAVLCSAGSLGSMPCCAML